MAHIEPMDIDAIESDFDNKENAFHCKNVFSRTPCTEKGYEELDVSELNMKLRYSITPASSPMSKSLTGPCVDNRICNSDDYVNNTEGPENGNLTRSLNSTLTKAECIKSNILPLQTLSTDPFVDNNRNLSIRRLLEPTENNVLISVNNVDDIDEKLSLPSSCSSVPDTPEATTPTKEIPKTEGSPIMRGLKSVLSMFRPSQSPILPADDKTKMENHSSVEFNKSDVQTVKASTPVAVYKERDANSSRRSSPLKASLVFNDDLEKELQWKDETTIIFKDEKIPVHKLFFQNPITEIKTVPKTLNALVEHMDISGDESVGLDKTNTDIEGSDKSAKRVLPVVEPSDESAKREHPVAGESDVEFLDCETTFTKNDSHLSNNQLDLHKVTVTGNATVELLNYPENSKDSEINYISKTIGDVRQNEITACSDPSDTEITGIIHRNYVKIIEETTKLLNSERNYCSNITYNVCLQDTQLIDEKNQLVPLDLNITLSSEENVIKEVDVINAEAKLFATVNMNNDTTTSPNLEDEVMRSSSQGVCNIEHPPDVCAKLLNNIDDIKDSRGFPHSIETKENTEIDVNITITDKNITTDLDSIASDTTASNKESIDIIGNLPKVAKCNMSNKLGSTVEVESKTHLILSSNVVDTNLAHGVSGEDQKLIANEFATLESVNEASLPKLIDGETPLDNSSDCGDAYNSDSLEVILEGDPKIFGNMLITSNKDEDNKSIKTAITLSGTDLTNLSDSPTAQTLLNDEVSTTNVNRSSLSEINITTKSNNNHFENNLDIKNFSSPQLRSDDSMDSKIDMHSLCLVSSTKPIVNNILNNDREIPELIVESETTLVKSSSKIVSLDEDNIDNTNLGMDGMCIIESNNQDTSFEVNEEECVIDVKSALQIDSMECDQTRAIFPIEENKPSVQSLTIINPIDEYNPEITNTNVPDYKDVKNTQTLITENAYKSIEIPSTVAEIMDLSSEKMEQDKTVSELKSAEDNIIHVDHSPITLERIYENVKQDSLQMKMNENTEYKIIHEKVSTNNEIAITETDINTNKHADINIVDQFANLNEVKVGDNNREDFASQEMNVIDEEIITSSNNSPYVSVMELDLDAVKIITDRSEKYDSPSSPNTKTAISPPISPKIVSKGYNFSFDEIDDPFATKTKIRMSPTPDLLMPSNQISSKKAKTLQEVPKKVNRRKSQPQRKTPIKKNSINSVVTDKLNSKELTCDTQNSSVIITKNDDIMGTISTSHIKENVSESKPDIPEIRRPNQEVDSSELIISNADDVATSVVKTQSKDEEMKSLEQTLVVSTEKSTSSSEQYFSLGTSSGESTDLMNCTKNVFNLPEIDDVNFNPFVTKAKMHTSPPLFQKATCSSELPNVVSNSTTIEQYFNNSATKKNMEVILDTSINHSSPNNNTSNTNCSSTTINDTVKEIHTEDEDTIEGPFLEVDDLRDTQKLTDVEGETDMMNFEEVPQRVSDENLENGELFIDADAFEFLLSQKNTTVLDSGKESLFLKFDPLFAKRVSSDGIIAALSKIQKRQSTPNKVTKSTQKDFSPLENAAGPSNDNKNCGSTEEYNEDLTSTMTKPMMVVNPAVSSVATQKIPATPKLNRRSLTFTSPAMAVIDRLLSLSGNSSHTEHDASIPQIVEQSETELAITQLRELLAKKEINNHSLRSESKALKDRLAALEVQVRSVETESAERLAKINELNNKLSEKTKMNKSMAIVVEEYERTIASIIAETEQDKKRNAAERMKLIKERDEQTAHLTSMEVSFSDLHSKYEKSKQIILSCKEREDVYKKTLQEFNDNFSKMQNNYELLKQHATSKLNHANHELEKMNRAHEAEVLKMNAMIKRKELHITSLEETLAQKTKANEELTAICDELINKVG